MHGAESDVSTDAHAARSRDAGGPDPAERPSSEDDDRDAESTTGTEHNQNYVGRVAGQDAGYAGETGAEARAEGGDRR
jgi:hypothetical protein